MIKPLMTWEQSQRRWRKWYKGTLYLVSCRQLSVPETKLESFQAANAWWVKKRAEIDGQRPPHPYDRVIAEMAKRRDFLIAHGGDASEWEGWIRSLQSWKKDPNPPLPHEHADSFLYGLEPAPSFWANLMQQDKQLPPPDRIVATQVDAYLDLLMARVRAKNLSVSEYDSARLCLHALRDWIGGHSLIDVITPDLWERYYKFLLDSKISVRYKRHRLRHARTFITWLAGKGLIVPPLNLTSRLYRFGTAENENEVIPLTVQEVRDLVGKAKGILRLHLLLMLNCGFTQRDISDLHPDEILWEEGRIDRRRSKTKKMKTPYVAWKLWDVTLTLLKRFAHKEGDHALLTESGRTWMRDEIKNGKRSKTDSIKSLYVNAGLAATPLKRLRSTGSSMIKHKFDGETSDHWLGHGPKNVSDRSYRAKNQAKLDEAVEWLGKTYGLI